MDEGIKRPRILVLSNMYPSKRSLTYGIFVKNQVESLRKRNFQVDVIAIDDPRMGKRSALIKYGKWACKSLFNILLRGRKYQVVHAHYVFPTGLIGLLYKKLFKTKLVVTAHGGDIDRMARKNERTYKWTKQILDGADHVIAVGEKLKADIVHDFSIDSDKVSVLNMGVNRSVFHPVDKKNAAEQVGIDPGDFHILFVGNFIKEKGLEELAAAFGEVIAKHPEARLHLMGQKKNESFYQHVLTLFEGEKDRVHFYPAKPQKELALWMSAADLFVLPSHIEGFGLVALEAMACGTPVIGTEVGGLKYLLEGGYGLLVQPKNSMELTKAINECIENETLVQDLIRKAEEKADQYSEEKTISALCQIYGY